MVEDRPNVRKILSSSSSLLLLAKTIGLTHPTARSLCDSWASCIFKSSMAHFVLVLCTTWWSSWPQVASQVKLQTESTYGKLTATLH